MSLFSYLLIHQVRQRAAAPLQTRNTRPVVRASLPEVTNGHNVPAPEDPVEILEPESAPESEPKAQPESVENGPRVVRASVKIRAPPGGKSSGFW